MKRVLYPASFDPITNGHINIINRALKIFDNVVIAIMDNPNKKSLLSKEDRLDIIKKIFNNNPNVEVIIGSGATIDVCKDNKCNCILRGLRSSIDFENEKVLDYYNKELSSDEIDTVYLMSDRELEFISSSAVKELFNLKKDISKYVPNEVLEILNLQKKA